MINLKKLSLAIVGLLYSFFATAQQFQYRSNLDTVTSSGFYAIPITPELSSHLKTDFSDFRIADSLIAGSSSGLLSTTSILRRDMGCVAC